MKGIAFIWFTLLAFSSFSQNTKRIELKERQSPYTLVVNKMQGDVIIKGKNIDHIELICDGSYPVEYSIGPDGKFEIKSLLNQSTITIAVPSSIHIECVVIDNYDMHIKNIEGDVKVKVLNGNIFLQNCSGNIEATTTNGDIFLKDIKGSIVANTTNGDVLLKLLRTNNQPSHIASMNGDIEVVLKGDFDFSIQAKTTSGSIKASEEYIIAREVGVIGESVELKKGNAKNTLTLKNFNGDIRVIEKQRIK